MIFTRHFGGAQVFVADPAALWDGGVLSTWMAALSPAERSRMRRFRFERDRRSYAAAHGLTRAALSARMSSIPPSAWRFRPSEYGRPEVETPARGSRLRFNLSHTDGLVACLVTEDIDCGIDVEHLNRATDTHRLAQRVLTSRERRDLLALAPASRSARFFAHWTLKEAYLKARGRGLSIPLDQCGFGFDARGRLLTFEAPPDDDAGAWRFDQWMWRGSHVIAIAQRDRHDLRDDRARPWQRCSVAELGMSG